MTHMWKKFWEDMNIRKLLALLIVGVMLYMVIVTSDEKMNTALLGLAATIVGYYFGYENGKKVQG